MSIKVALGVAVSAERPKVTWGRGTSSTTHIATYIPVPLTVTTLPLPAVPLTVILAVLRVMFLANVRLSVLKVWASTAVRMTGEGECSAEDTVPLVK